MVGSPSTIHSASCQPAPPAAVTPKEWPSLSQKFLHARRRADDRRAVRRIGDGAVVDLLDADLAERRNARDRRLDMRRETIEVLLERARIRCPPTAHRHSRPARLFRKARAAGRPPPRACTRRNRTSRSTPISGRPLRLALDDLGMRLGDDILVLDRDHRHVDPDHARRSGARNCRSPRRHARRRCRPCRSTTFHSPLGSRSIAVTVVWRLISAPRSRAPRASACVRSAGWM